VKYRDLKKIVGQKPFRPFEVRMEDGTRRRFNQRVGFLLGLDQIITIDERGRAVYLPLASMSKLVYLDEIVEVY
jgi:hypothetical protein